MFSLISRRYMIRTHGCIEGNGKHWGLLEGGEWEEKWEEEGQEK